MSCITLVIRYLIVRVIALLKYTVNKKSPAAVLLNFGRSSGNSSEFRLSAKPVGGRARKPAGGRGLKIILIFPLHSSRKSEIARTGFFTNPPIRFILGGVS